MAIISMLSETTKPRDLSHHFSRAARRRVPNVMKEYYRFLRIPGMGSFAGGSPYPGYFPFDDLKVSVVRPESLFPNEDRFPCSGESKTSVSGELIIERHCESARASEQVDLDTTLQYGYASGHPALHALIKRLVTTVYHPNVPYQGGTSVIMSGGAADGLAKVYDVFFNTWDEGVNKVEDREGLIVEEFVYPPAVAQARSKNPNIVAIKMDAEGAIAYGSGGLVDVLEKWDISKGKRPHLLYTVPTGQNPTSAVLSLQRRKEIYDVCSRFDILIVEDDPYWNLYYPSASMLEARYRDNTLTRNAPENTHVKDLPARSQNGTAKHTFINELVPSFLSIDVDGRVIRLDTFSKTIAPGCRLGYMTAQPNIIEQLFRVTDATTQQPSGFVQALVAKLIGNPATPDSLNPTNQDNHQNSIPWGFTGWIHWLEGLRNQYQRRMITMASTFDQHRFKQDKTGTHEMFSFSWPRGGMFIWVKLHILDHPLASYVNPKRLALALWILCTQEPYRIIMNPGRDFAANEEIRDEKGYMYLRFCFAAVDEGILVQKSRAFTAACAEFWDLCSSKDIDQILEEEDRLSAATNGGVDGVEAERFTGDE